MVDAASARHRTHRLRDVRRARPERHLGAQPVLGDEQVALRVFELVAIGDEVKAVREGERDGDVRTALESALVNRIRRIELDLCRLAHLVALRRPLDELRDVLLEFHEIALPRLDAGVRRQAERHLEGILRRLVALARGDPARLRRELALMRLLELRLRHAARLAHPVRAARRANHAPERLVLVLLAALREDEREVG